MSRTRALAVILGPLAVAGLLMYLFLSGEADRRERQLAAGQVAAQALTAAGHAVDGDLRCGTAVCHGTVDGKPVELVITHTDDGRRVYNITD